MERLIPKVELISITQESERIIEEVGRVCYNSTPGNPAIIKNWIKSGHHSMVEFGHATFKLTNVSRALLAQITRHRLASFQVRSQRYVDETSFNFIIPESIAGNEEATDIYLSLMDDIRATYSKLLALGIKKEDSRMVLPNSCTTEIVIGANFREWRHILELRLDKHAQKEIRDVSKLIYKELIANAPNVFGDIEIIE